MKQKISSVQTQEGVYFTNYILFNGWINNTLPSQMNFFFNKKN